MEAQDEDLQHQLSLQLPEESLVGSAGGQPFQLVGRVMKAHARVIWACSWAPDDRKFATGARDSTVKVWQLGQPGQGRHLQWRCCCATAIGLHIAVFRAHRGICEPKHGSWGSNGVPFPSP